MTSRFLSGVERGALLALLRERWPPAPGDSWHPWDACGGPHVLGLESSWFEHELRHAALAARLRAKTGPLVYRLCEGAPHWSDDPPPSDRSGWRDQELPVDDARVGFGGGETVWVPPGLGWLVYTDHDECTSLVGEWLTATVRDLWPEWSRHVWTTPFHERHPHDRR